nr:hypothetical protein [candidate division Zixibacteria bacterium]
MEKANLLARLVILTLVVCLSVPLMAQESIGGPYQPDSATVLLLHFDGDFSNESIYSADAVGYGNYSFSPTSVDSSLQLSLRLENPYSADSAYVTVADTPALDLIDDWTMEAWVYPMLVLCGHHTCVPRIIIKTGDSVFWR